MGMISELKNDFLHLKVKHLGAEPCSLFSIERKKELLWQADAAVWGRHAPVLFPIVGKLKNNSYGYQDKNYSLPQHGFARDSRFKLVEATEQLLCFELKESEESLAKYPFRFCLQINYRLQNRVWTTEYVVSNTDDRTIYFSVGAHPGFVCPLYENEQLEDYVLEFEQDEVLTRYLISDGLIGPETESIILEQGKLPLHAALFSCDALVMKHLHSSAIRLRSEKYQLRFSWYNMPYFGIWSKPGASGFICLEPWAGIADGVDVSGKLEEKEGVICLQPGQEYRCGLSAELC